MRGRSERPTPANSGANPLADSCVVHDRLRMGSVVTLQTDGEQLTTRTLETNIACVFSKPRADERARRAGVQGEIP